MNTQITNPKRKLGEIWKSGNGRWYVQFPNGRDSYKTKKLATTWSKATLRQWKQGF